MAIHVTPQEQLAELEAIAEELVSVKKQLSLLAKETDAIWQRVLAVTTAIRVRVDVEQQS